MRNNGNNIEFLFFQKKHQFLSKNSVFLSFENLFNRIFDKVSKPIFLSFFFVWFTKSCSMNKKLNNVQ